MNYLEFEKEVQEIDKELIETSQENQRNKLLRKKDYLIKDIYKNLTPWQCVQVSRHQDRPYSLDYIDYLVEDFTELHGDRTYGDDQAIIAGLGYFEGEKVFVIGQQKGRDSDERIKRNFGYPNPEGYRKALRVGKLASKFNIPIIIFIDTPGAFAGAEAEAKGQAYAIANNLLEFFEIRAPIISIVIGEGGSGGALALAVADKLYMLKYSVFSVISPESCSSILFRSSDRKEEAANLLKLTADSAKEYKLIDGIIDEPYGGAHRYFKETAESIKKQILQDFKYFKIRNIDYLLSKRIKKYMQLGDNLIEKAN